MKRKATTEPAADVTAEMACNCILMRARLISRMITNLYDHELRPFGLNSPQFALLVVMSKMGPASRAEIGRFHHQDRSTLTRNLKIMLSEGWIEEAKDGSGGRARPMILTRAGRKLLQDVATPWREAQIRAKALLGSQGVDAVTEIANQFMKSAA